MYNLHPKCLMKCLNEFFIDCLISYGVDLKQWTPHLFKAQVRFNGGTRHSFKVRVDITLKDLNDRLNEINQELNRGDTRMGRTFSMHVPDICRAKRYC